MVRANPIHYSDRVRKSFAALGGPGKLVLLFLLCVGIPAVGSAGYKPGKGWPEVSTLFFHAATPIQAEARVAHWHNQPGCVISTYHDTGSMHPVLQGGRELLAMELCQPQTLLAPGMMVQFNRGDLPAVLHYIAAISPDGRKLYLSGVNCRYSDGWFPRSRVKFVVREIITAPDSPLIGSIPALAQAAPR